MALKESVTVYVGGVAVNDFAADADFTTDAIEWSDLKGFSVNIWFAVLNGSTPLPKIDVQVSNTNDLLSFTKLNNLTEIELPELFTKTTLKPSYIRFVYDSSGVDAGSFINIDFNKISE